MKKTKLFNELVFVYLLYMNRVVKKSELDKYINKSIRTYHRYKKEIEKSYSLYKIHSVYDENEGCIFYLKYKDYDDTYKPKNYSYYMSNSEKKKKKFDMDKPSTFIENRQKDRPDEYYDLYDEAEKKWQSLKQIINRNYENHEVCGKHSGAKNIIGNNLYMADDRLFRTACFLMKNIDSFNEFISNSIGDKEYKTIEEASKQYIDEPPIKMYHSKEHMNKRAFLGGKWQSRRTYQRDKKIVLEVLKYMGKDYIDTD